MTVPSDDGHLGPVVGSCAGRRGLCAGRADIDFQVAAYSRAAARVIGLVRVASQVPIVAVPTTAVMLTAVRVRSVAQGMTSTGSPRSVKNPRRAASRQHAAAAAPRMTPMAETARASSAEVRMVWPRVSPLSRATASSRLRAAAASATALMTAMSA